jgi:hypothetical protein
MIRTIAAAALAAALTLVAPQAMAGDTTNMEKSGDTTKMQPDAKGAPSDQPAGAETSDRTPEKTTPTPDTQVDKTKEGETSTRTPEKK